MTIQEKPKYTPVWEYVTPELAAEYLKTNTNNRKSKQATVDRIASDIVNGLYTPTHQGGAFYSSGVLADAQHRFKGIVKAGIGVWMLITRGLPTDVGLNIDGILTRSSSDQITIDGRMGVVDCNEVAIMRRMVRGLSAAKKMSPATEFEEMKKHLEAIRFSVRALPTQASMTAASRAAISRAWYAYADKEKLTRFCRVLSVGMATAPDEGVIVLLWKALTTRNFGDGSNTQILRYALTERAIAAFMAGENIKKLIPTSKELFPMSGETSTEAVGCEFHAAA